MTYSLVPKITNDQRQIILGTILGGSSIVKPSKGRNCYLSMRSNNPIWIQCKAQELISFVPETPLLKHQGNYYRWHSKCSPLFNDFYDLFYKDGEKSVSMETLDEIRDIGLAVWYLDCGKLIDGKIEMKLFGFPDKSVIQRYFEVIGLNNNLVKTKLMFEKAESERFLKVISEYMPSFKL